MINDDFLRVEITDRGELRRWLSKNHQRSEGVWLVVFKKHCGDRHVPHGAIVEEVLCFGWIDSLVRKLDDERSMLFLSPRRPKSPWSRVNKALVDKLEARGAIKPPGRAKIEAAKADGSWTILDDVEALVVPEDLAEALRSTPKAKANFDRFSDSSKKNILWWIKSAKREATRQKRIRQTVELAAKNLRANHPEDRR